MASMGAMGSMGLMRGTLANHETAAGKASASLPVVNVAMNGKTISVTGALKSGGVKVVSTVTKEKQGDPTFVRLDDGVTLAQFMTELPKISKNPENLYGYGSVVMSAQANKGTSWVETDLAPGQYVAADIEHSGKPPLTTFKVAKAASPASLPKPAATVTSIEFGYRGPGTLHDGQLIRFANQGFLVHMTEGIRASSKADAEQIAKLLKAGQEGKAGKLATGEYSFDNLLSHGGYQQYVVGVPTGYWVIACFMNTQDGRDHTQLGMERVIDIVK
jgi:hypothetical protein